MKESCQQFEDFRFAWREEIKEAINILVERNGGQYFPVMVNLLQLGREGQISDTTMAQLVRDVLKEEI